LPKEDGTEVFNSKNQVGTMMSSVHVSQLNITTLRAVALLKARRMSISTP